jgi:hypothetical protein
VGTAWCLILLLTRPPDAGILSGASVHLLQRRSTFSASGTSRSAVRRRQPLFRQPTPGERLVFLEYKPQVPARGCTLCLQLLSACA